MEADDRVDPEPVWIVQYLLDEPRFVASYRAARLARQRDYDSFVMRLGLGFVAHFFLAAGILVFALWLMGKRGSNGPIPWGAALLNLALAAGGGYCLYDFVYFKDARLTRLFRQSALAGEKHVYTLSPSRFGLRHSLAEFTVAWCMVQHVTELNDGFVLLVSEDAHWIPRDAIDQDFSDVSIAEFLRTKVGDYRVLNRTAGVSGKTTSRDELR